MQRREQMSRPEQWKCRSVLDDKPMYEWILKARILPLPKGVEGGVGEMARLEGGRGLFWRGEDGEDMKGVAKGERMDGVVVGAVGVADGAEGVAEVAASVGLQMLLLDDDEEYDEEADGDYVDEDEEEEEEEEEEGGPDGPSPRKKVRVTFVLPGEEEGWTF